MNPTSPSTRWFLAFALLSALPLLPPSLLAQDAADPDQTQEPAKPKPTIFKAGEKVQVKWGSSWWDATIVSNQGGGKYLIKWSNGRQTPEVKSAADIKRPGEAEDPSPRPGARVTSRKDANPQPSTPGSYKVGDTITYKVADKTVTGTITTVVSATIVKAVAEGEEEEKVVITKNIISSDKSTPAAAPATSAKAKPAAGSNTTGYYVRGDEIEYDRSRKATVIRDRGATVLVLEHTFKSITEINRANIQTAPSLEKLDPAFAKLITANPIHIPPARTSSRPNPDRGPQATDATRYVPGPASLDAQPPTPRIKIENPKSTGTGNRPADKLFVCAVNPVGFVTFLAETGKPGHMIQYDLTTGKPVKTLEFPDSEQVVDVTPNGARAITLAKGKLTLWSIQDKDPVKTLSFEAFGPGSDFTPDHDQAYLVGDNFLMTVSGDGNEASLLRVGLDNLTCVWFATPPEHGTKKTIQLALTPQRTAFSYSTWTQFDILDTISGKTYWDDVRAPFSGCGAFSTDGKRFAVYVPSLGLHIHNVPDRTLEKTILLPTGTVSATAGPSSLQWIGSANILIDNRYLLNIKSGLIAWEFSDFIPFTCTGSGIAWALHTDPKGVQTLASTYLLDTAVTAAIDNASTANNTILKEGDSVALEVGAIEGGPSGTAERARQAYENYFQLKKIKVDPNAPIKLKISGTADAPKELKVREGFNESKVTYRTSAYKVELIKNGKSLWATHGGYRGPGMTIVRKENETYQQIVDKGIQDAYSWLEKPSMPIPLLKSLKENPPPTSPLFP